MSPANLVNNSRMDLLHTATFLFLTAILAPTISRGQSADSSASGNFKTAASVDRPEMVVADYSKKIKLILPDGWSIKSEKNVITVERDKPIEYYGTISLPNHKDLADLKAKGFVHSGKYTIALEFFPPMSDAEIDKLTEENRRIEKRYRREHPQPEGSKPHGIPKEVRDSLHHIPNISTEKYSVFFDPSIQGRLAFFDNKEKKECEGVEQDIRRLMKSAK